VQGAVAGRRQVHVHVNDPVTLVKDANRLDVVGTAAAVGGLERAGQLDVGIGSHALSISHPQKYFYCYWDKNRVFQGLEKGFWSLRLDPSDAHVEVRQLIA
jgi:hypothetical protein